jgi:predicted molibdopterin-dependent oxidoreductase YjgC
MRETVTITVNGNSVRVQSDMTVIAAIGISSISTRRSVRGMARGPVCGMGICQECRVRIDGEGHRLACQTLCRDGMRIDTDEGVV